MPTGDPAPRLHGRRAECEALDRLVAKARAGRSQVLVLRGEAGVGKTALLEYLVERASGCRIARAVGVESEMELAFAGLHQLCAPFRGRIDGLPDPQRHARSTAFGLRTGEPPDQFLVGLASLTLLAEVAEERPLVCVVDDAEWLDRASTQALEFVARRLQAESVGLVFAVRDSEDEQELAGVVDLVVHGLLDGDARALLESVVTGPLDEDVRDRILAETRGNPLALLELPQALTPAELAGGFGLFDAMPLANRIEQRFLRRLLPLPLDTRRLLLAAAVEPVGDAALLWRAADCLGIETDAASAAEGAGLIEIGTQVRFRHPLVRSAACRAASPRDLREVHRALAEVTDADLDPDRRAWHLAHAAVRPSEGVAGELERSARPSARARRRRGRRRLPGAGDGVDPRPADEGSARFGRPPTPNSTPPRRTPLSSSSPSPRPAHSTPFNKGGRRGSPPSWPSLVGGRATLRHCSSARRGDLSRSMPAWPGRLTSRPSEPSSSPAALVLRDTCRRGRVRPPARSRRGPSTSCWMGWQCGSPTATHPPSCRSDERLMRSPARTGRDDDVSWLWLAWFVADEV